MLPRTDHSPPGPAEPSISVGISRTILLDLLTPEFGIGLRPGTVFGASVPKAAIDKNGQPIPTKQDIGTPSHSWKRGSVDTVPKTCSMEERPYSHLGAGIALPNRLHSAAGLL
jgi:hypothetical protein